MGWGETAAARVIVWVVGKRGGVGVGVGGAGGGDHHLPDVHDPWWSQKREREIWPWSGVGESVGLRQDKEVCHSKSHAWVWHTRTQRGSVCSGGFLLGESGVWCGK